MTATYDPSGDYTIYLKDGTQIQPATDGQRIKDMNGNSILVTATSAKDEQTGREIKWSKTVYGANNDEATKVEFQSVGGDWQTVWVVWGETSVQGRIYKTKDWNPNALPNGATCDKFDDVDSTPFDVVRQIILPSTEQNAQQYTFEYNSDTTTTVTTPNVRFSCGPGAPPSAPYTRDVSGGGAVSKITTPTGVELKYEYYFNALGNLGTFLPDFLIRDVVKKKEVVHDGTTDIWEYNVPIGSFAEQSSLKNPDGSTYEEKFYPTDPIRTHLAGTNGLGGLVYRTTTAGRVMTEKRWILLGGSTLPAFGSSGDYVTFNPVVDTEFTSILDGNGNRVKMSARKFQYDYNGELLQTIEYDWLNLNAVTYDSLGLPTGVPTGTTVLRTVNNAYYNQAPNINSANAYQKRTLGTSPVLLGLPKQTTVGNSETRLSYDGQVYGTAPTKGNITQSSVWDSATNQWLNSTTAYSLRGNPTLVTDPKGNQTQIIYGSINGYTDLYPTQTISAYGTAIQRTFTTQYDFYTGLVTSSTDVDNDVTSVTEYDILGRPVRVKAAVNTPEEIWSQIEYSDSERRVITRSDLEVKEDKKSVAIQHLDQLGRVRLSRRLEDATAQSPYNEADGIKVETKYWTGDPESYQLVSNPYRATNEPTMGWTRSKSLNNGKYSEVETFTGAALPAPWGTNTNSTGVVRTDIDVDRTLVTDQAGKKRISKTNALGQLVNVWEVKESDADTEAINFGSPAVSLHGLKTSYQYDVLNNLTQVSQGGQTRTFTYSSLSRLLSANNPESGTISYLYDAIGNLTRKTDARNIKTIYDYDALNRLTNRCYTKPNPSSTPANCASLSSQDASTDTLPVAYTYDTLANAKGRLTKVTTGDPSAPFSVTEYQAFDKMGRVKQSEQKTQGLPTGLVPMTYTYNLSGALVEQMYPSGRKVKNVLDNNGDLALVQSKKNANFGYSNYAKSFTYNAAGAVTSMQLGNGRWESTQFNSRLQPTQIALGATQSATNLLKLDYSYGTTQNNGNVLSQTITVPTVTLNNTPHPGFTAVQTYTYDALNRLQDAKELSDSTQTWKQTFVYDRFGNRTFNEGKVDGNYLTTTLPRNCPEIPNTAMCPADHAKFNPSANTSDNKLVGYTFDAAGNTTKDAESRKFTYDGENKQIKVETLDANGNPLTTLGDYSYDGDGKRIKKGGLINGQWEETIFVYDAGGKLVAEYSNQSSQTPQVSYLTNDHLGSPRITTDENGKTISRRDFQPFGEEIETTQRTAGLGYTDDSIRQKFTSYERDNETDLDFAQARYHNYNHGRFMSPDPIAGSCINPQSHNKYAYAWNNPLILTDPTGLIVSWEDSEKKKKEGETEAKTDKQRAYEKRLDEMINSDDKKTRERGLKLKATYERLQRSDITFHVVTENPSGASSGELTYKGQEGHLYVNLKGDNNAYGALTDIQKIAHEFKHGEQFLDGKIGFIRNEKGEWKGYRDDLPDEAEAFITGFEAQPLGPSQRSGSTGEFLNSIGNAIPSGLNAVVDALDGKGPYKGRSKTQLEMRFVGGKVPPNVYAVPKK